MSGKNRSLTILIPLTLVFLIGIFATNKSNLSRQSIVSSPDKQGVFNLLKNCENILVTSNSFTGSDRYQCYVTVLDESLKKFGLKNTSDNIELYLKTEDGERLRDSCHTWGHQIGEIAVRLGYSSKEILNNCTDSCLDGCFNGAAHGYITLNKSLDSIDQFCNPPGFSGDKNRVIQCFHGVGHGILDVISTNIKEAEVNCRKIRLQAGRAECTHAIFMIFNHIPPSRVQPADIPDDMLAYCSTLSDKYQQYCYAYSGYLTFGKNKSTRSALHVCDNVPQSSQGECYDRIGDSINLNLPPGSNKDIKTLSKVCDEAKSESAITIRIIGIARSMIASGSPPDEFFQACEIIPKKTALSCYKNLGQQIKDIRGIGDQDKYCSALKDPFSKACLGIN